jgi:segregation and condensation protein B
MEQSMEVKPKVEALLVAADRWVKIADLARVLGLPSKETEDALLEFDNELLGADRGIQLRRKGDAVRIEIKAPYVSLIGELFTERRPKPITGQADEVLAVIAHTQPVSVQGVSDIRGKESAAVIASLAERGLIQRLKRLGPNRERLWKVSQRFLDLHNLNRVDEIFKEEVAERVFPGLVATSQGTSPPATM